MRAEEVRDLLVEMVGEQGEEVEAMLRWGGGDESRRRA